MIILNTKDRMSHIIECDECGRRLGTVALKEGMDATEGIASAQKIFKQTCECQKHQDK